MWRTRFWQYDIAARIPDSTKLASWAVGPYYPYPYLNITGHIRVLTLISDLASDSRSRALV
jgi:hypothetical protein